MPLAFVPLLTIASSNRNVKEATVTMKLFAVMLIASVWQNLIVTVESSGFIPNQLLRKLAEWTQTFVRTLGVIFGDVQELPAHLNRLYNQEETSEPKRKSIDFVEPDLVLIETTEGAAEEMLLPSDDDDETYGEEVTMTTSYMVDDRDIQYLL